MTIRHQITIALALVIVSSADQSCLAQDILIAGKVHSVKNSKLVKFVAKSKDQPGEALFVLPAAGGGSDPTMGGATLNFEDVGDSGNVASYTLDASGWKGLGKPVGSKGYKYKGKDDTTDANPKGTCSVVLLKEKVLKAVCKDTVPLTTPFVGASSIVLAVPAGPRYCAEFGGDESKNDDKAMKRKNAPPPALCPMPIPTSTPTSTDTETPTPTSTATPTATVAATLVTCDFNALALSGGPFLYQCPAGCSAAVAVWGTDIYTNDSSLCTTAAHAGVTTLAGGGNVVLTLLGSQGPFIGSTQNGITTSSYGAPYPGYSVSVP